MCCKHLIKSIEFCIYIFHFKETNDEVEFLLNQNEVALDFQEMIIKLELAEE